MILFTSFTASTSFVVFGLLRVRNQACRNNLPFALDGGFGLVSQVPFLLSLLLYMLDVERGHDADGHRIVSHAQLQDCVTCTSL